MMLRVTLLLRAARVRQIEYSSLSSLQQGPGRERSFDVMMQRYGL